MAGTVVLIHGAWQGSWVWTRLAPRLEAAGLAAVAVDLPGNGADGTPPETASLDRYVAHVGAIVAAQSGPVALVGHSGGGVVATAVAERFCERVERVAYVAGMMLPPGMGFGDVLNDMKAAEKGLLGIGPHLVWSPDGRVSSVPVEAAADVFLNELPRDEALRLAKGLTPQGEGGRAISTAWTPQRFGTLPRLYVECVHDRSVLLPVQRRMQDLVPGAARVTLDADHAPHVSHPRRLADALVPFLKG
ncbi:alpha/beta fold hydrolase [Aquibium sp. ELW1220]|uniref:alpha/beta fold hydrolase n=1 Tax=Aquibium sp. ELW1220 TaxID=2976766 RepID=UPI0025B0A931|nr:alpha/beta fold hydrolase [Aquibium sp. ELW1220]MDN2584190.1 alpha/beta fold hydrolase [Aquibium sp. ELW1220]